jgi:hypothetical protein
MRTFFCKKKNTHTHICGHSCFLNLKPWPLFPLFAFPHISSIVDQNLYIFFVVYVCNSFTKDKKWRNLKQYNHAFCQLIITHWRFSMVWSHQRPKVKEFKIIEIIFLFNIKKTKQMTYQYLYVFKMSNKHIF